MDRYKAGWAVGLLQKNKIVAHCSHLHAGESDAVECGRALAKDWRRKRGPGRIAVARIEAPTE
jgi:hypothetical protein